MTDPERISKRTGGLAAELVRAGAQERPRDASVERTLIALGASSAILGVTSVATAAGAGAATVTGTAATGAQLSGAVSAGGAKAVSLGLLAKWVGIGVVGGVGLASVASVVSGPEPSVAPVTSTAPSTAKRPRVAPALSARGSLVPPIASPEPAPEPERELHDAKAAAAHALAGASAAASAGNRDASSAADVGVPLAAEVTYVDRARALIRSGQAGAGLALLDDYERQFPGARLLPEVLFLELETLDRTGHGQEARAAAQRLIAGFPSSPHASRARKLLER